MADIAEFKGVQIVRARWEKRSGHLDDCKSGAPAVAWLKARGGYAKQRVLQSMVVPYTSL